MMIWKLKWNPQMTNLFLGIKRWLHLIVSCFKCFFGERGAWREYSFHELSRAAKLFSNGNLIGSGGFGDVYKGSLHGKDVAIKKFKHKINEKPQGKSEEIEYLKKVNHQNLVKLIGYCDDGIDKLLVLEYVPNKCLRHHLDGGNLNWSQRMNIAIKSARGLHYLHKDCNIIHRDIKPNNILLDDLFEPKIADFSLSMFLPKTDKSHITSTWQGTNIYADSEYGDKQNVCEKLDIYSFGIVLLELITGKKPTFDEGDIVNWAHSRITAKDRTDFVDLKLQGEYNEMQMENIINCAQVCVYEPSQSRPNMETIIQILEGKEALLKTSLRECDPINLECLLGIESKQINSPKIYSYDEVAKATGSFSNNNLISKNTIYLGSFDDKKNNAAIKKLEYLGENVNEQKIQEEIEAISHICYPHIVKLIGYCVDGSDRLLVYEYFSNKSLLSQFHENGGAIMDWPSRMKIAVGVAKGLAYLHEFCQPQIVHGNIKMDNIFVGESFQPKISNYRLAKDVLWAFKFKSSNVGNLKGKSVYLAPEYREDEKLTDKSDIFSLGIVFLELITGKPAIGNEDGVKLSIWAAPLLKKALPIKDYSGLVDARLKDNYNREEMIRMIYCAASCVYKRANYRPRANC
ncbi:putative proline-rich receptor-like protein kinase PERK6 isoform X4 [Manihot esculenta]|uniref:Uncharacterized protein n=1 Tax=Manihot esculenta TaxID=3983 RepID=A0ACB7GSQ3_MANES|nr:putative proline-rich receptor-like protein kinase PERK6 isoform X4 [Manihot esculenta]KAG8642996.1 hypothetical protein MANES_12G154800v8 [Manihot esculenta]